MNENAEKEEDIVFMSEDMKVKRKDVDQVERRKYSP
jgi:hypothetical protein